VKRLIIVVFVIAVLGCVGVFISNGITNTLLLNMGVTAAIGVYLYFYEYLIKIRWINIGIAVFASCYALIGIFAMVYGRNNTTTFEEEVAIVLGSRINGTEPADSLRNRLNMAIYFHFRNPDALIIVSGGLGRNEIITEALVMEQFLKNAGVSPYVIIQEDASNSTFQNMQLSMQIIENLFDYPPSAVVITNDFHIYRGVRFAYIAGLSATSLYAPTPLHQFFPSLFREVAAILKMWIFGT